MKIFGSLRELVAAVFRKDSQEIQLKPNSSSYSSVTNPVVELPPPASNTVILVSETSSQTLTNKTISTGSSVNTNGNIVTSGDMTANDITLTGGDIFLGGGTTTATVFNSASTLTVGGTQTGGSAYNLATGATSSSNTKTVNIGTGGVSGSTTNINVGSAAGSGTITLNENVTLGKLTTAGAVQVNASGVTSSGTLPVTSGGTGSTTASGARTNLSAASSGANSDITSITGLTTPLAPSQGGTGLSSLGTGVATFLGTPSSANLAAAVTGETGSGALVFGTSPALSNPTVSGDLLLQNAAGQAQPTLKFSEDPDNGTNSVTVQAPASLAASYTLTLPGDDGSSGQVLSTDGSGVLSWASSATVPSAGSVYSNGTSLQTTGSFTGNGNSVVGINSGGTAEEYKALSVGTTGTDFAIVHSAGSVAFNLPDASATARGVVSTGTQVFAGNKTFNGTISASNLTSGTYTPTFTLTNMTSGTARQSNYVRVGDIVFVTGVIDGLTLTTGVADVDVTITTLPIVPTNNFSGIYQASGVGKLGKANRVSNEAAEIKAVSASKSVNIHVDSTGLSTGDTAIFMYYSFSYQLV